MADDPIARRTYRLWIKAMQRHGFGLITAVAWTLRTPAGDTVEEFTTPPDLPITGCALRGLVMAAANVCAKYPDSDIHIACAEQAFWRAFHPDYNWLSTWQTEGWVRPKADKDAWQQLAQAMADHRVTITAGPPGEAGNDAAMLADCLDRARNFQTPKTPKERWEPKETTYCPDESDALTRHAIERDPWG